VVFLEKRDFNANARALEIRGGKGNKDRTVYLPGAACELVVDWLTLRGIEPGALLYPVTKGGRLLTRHMTPQAVLMIVRKRALEHRFSNQPPLAAIGFSACATILAI